MAAAFRAAAGGADAAGGTTRDSSSVALLSGDTAYVFVFNSDGSPAAPSSVVWDPTGANQSLGTAIADSGTIYSFGRVTCYRAQGLTPATAVFRASWSASQGERGIIALLYSDVNTVTPNGTVATNSGTNTSVTVTPANSAGQLVVAFAWALDINSDAFTMNLSSPSGTERREEFASPYDVGAGQDKITAAANEASTWTVSNTSGGANYEGWYAIAIPINEAAAPTSSLLRRSPGARLAPYLHF